MIFKDYTKAYIILFFCIFMFEGLVSFIYYLVDTWFPYPTGVEELQPVTQKEHWQLYELDALPRLRFADESPVDLEDFEENPNKILFAFNNMKNHQQLIMADRYDENWQVEVNGEKVKLKNYQGMRLVDIQPGQNNIRFYYFPHWFYLGLVISSVTLALASFVCLTRTRFAVKIFQYANKT